MEEKGLPEFIEHLWRKHLPNTVKRLEEIEQAVAKLVAGSLSGTDLHSAVRDAHKLAGSLGSYGLPKASELARRVEYVLESGALPPNAVLQLTEDLVAIRQAIEAGPPRSGEATATPAAAPHTEQPSIVVVEDDVLLRELLMHAFTLHNLSVRAYAEGDTALRDLTSAPPLRPRLLLLDIDLPGTSGMTILRELSGRGATNSMKIIMLTARNSEPEVMNSLRLGAIDHISKPFSVPILLEKVHRALQ